MESGKDEQHASQYDEDSFWLKVYGTLNSNKSF